MKRAVTVLLLAGALAGACSAATERRLGRSGSELVKAEALIDAFYSFVPARLRSAMADAPASMPRLLYYQGWAQGGNYVVLERKPCRLETIGEVSCDIKVRDDLIAALGTGYDVTYKFHLSLRNGRVVSVRNSSNDPREFDEALKWLGRERPALMEGPCRGFFAGGPTPQDCVRAVVSGFAEFARQRQR